MGTAGAIFTIILITITIIAVILICIFVKPSNATNNIQQPYLNNNRNDIPLWRPDIQNYNNAQLNTHNNNYSNITNTFNINNPNTYMQQPNTQNVFTPTCSPYIRKKILTNTELQFYKILSQHCYPNNIIICPKVRLEDIIEVNVKENNMKYRGYIKSRHVDFVLCNSDMNVLCAIELDDNSHNTDKAKRIDELKNNIFNAANLPLFRIKTDITMYNNNISNILNYMRMIKNNPYIS